MAQKLGELRDTAAHILDQLKRDDEVAVFAFAQRTERLVDLTPDREEVAAAIDEVRRPRGGTDITDALYEAITYLKRAAPDKRRVIILVSDNEATTRGEHEQDEVIDTAFEFETSIYGLHVDTHDWSDRFSRRGYYRGRAMRRMWAPVSVETIVEETGGEMMESARFGSLSSSLAELVSSLRTRYTLGYKPAGEQDGQTHRIFLSLTNRFGERGADYTIAYRRGYRRALVEVRAKE
jgi:VWFA-related protein